MRSKKNREKVKQQYVSVKEAAEYFGVSMQTVKNWGKRGILVLSNTGGNYMVSTKSMEMLKPQKDELGRQLEALEELKQELKAESEAYAEELRMYREERDLRKDSLQFVRLVLMLIRCLHGVLWDKKDRSEREFEIQEMFLSGVPLDRVAERVGVTRETVKNNVRKMFNLLHGLDSYPKMLEANREAQRKIERLEREAEMLHLAMGVYENNGIPLINLDYTARMMIPVKELGLSTHTLTILNNFDLEYLGDLLYLSVHDFMMMRGFGKNALAEVRTAVERFGFKLGARLEGWQTVKGVCRRTLMFRVCEGLHSLEGDKVAYLKTLLGDLPKEKVVEVVDFFKAMVDVESMYGQKLREYESVNKKLRKELSIMEKRLACGDFYLMPGFEEAKTLFKQVEKVKDNVPSYAVGVGAAAGALSLLDCIFSPEAYQAEAARVKQLENENRAMKQRLSGMDYRMARLRTMAKDASAEDVDIVGELKEEVEQMKKAMEQLKQENAVLEGYKKEKELYESDEVKKLRAQCKLLETKVKIADRDLAMAKTKIDARERLYARLGESLQGRLKTMECIENKKYWDIIAETLDCSEELADLKVKQQQTEKELAQYRKDKEEMVSRYRHELYNFWHILQKYEDEVDEFNRKGWHKKAFAKLEKHSDHCTKTLKEYLFEPDSYDGEAKGES